MLRCLLIALIVLTSCSHGSNQMSQHDAMSLSRPTNTVDFSRYSSVDIDKLDALDYLSTKNDWITYLDTYNYYYTVTDRREYQDELICVQDFATKYNVLLWNDKVIFTGEDDGLDYMHDPKALRKKKAIYVAEEYKNHFSFLGIVFDAPLGLQLEKCVAGDDIPCIADRFVLNLPDIGIDALTIVETYSDGLVGFVAFTSINNDDNMFSDYMLRLLTLKYGKESYFDENEQSGTRALWVKKGSMMLLEMKSEKSDRPHLVIISEDYFAEHQANQKDKLLKALDNL